MSEEVTLKVVESLILRPSDDQIVLQKLAAETLYIQQESEVSILRVQQDSVELCQLAFPQILFTM